MARLLPTRHDLLAVGLGVLIRSLGRDGQTTDAAVRQRRGVACTCRDGEKLYFVTVFLAFLLLLTRVRTAAFHGNSLLIRAVSKNRRAND